LSQISIAHRHAAADRGIVGGLADRVPSESLGLIGLHPLVLVYGQDGRREMRVEGAGQHCGWSGFAEPGQHHGGDTERAAEERPGAVGVVLQRRFLQRGQRPGRSPLRARMTPASVKAMPRTLSPAPVRVRARLSSMSSSAACGSLRQTASAAAKEAVADSAELRILRAISTASMAGCRAAA
jgi:hypothetical protein